MAQRERAFFRRLPSGDVIRVRFRSSRGRVLAFTAQLELWIDETWRLAVRYDSGHGQAHRDTLDWQGRVIDKVWLPATMTSKDALTFGERDLHTNAGRYRNEFIGRKP